MFSHVGRAGRNALEPLWNTLANPLTRPAKKTFDDFILSIFLLLDKSQLQMAENGILFHPPRRLENHLFSALFVYSFTCVPTGIISRPSKGKYASRILLPFVKRVT